MRRCVALAVGLALSLLARGPGAGRGPSGPPRGGAASSSARAGHSTSAGGAGSTWSAGGRGGPRSSWRPATAASPASGRTTCSSRSDPAPWSSPGWAHVSPASACTSAPGRRCCWTASWSPEPERPRPDPAEGVVLHRRRPPRAAAHRRRPRPLRPGRPLPGGPLRAPLRRHLPTEVAGLVLVDAWSGTLAGRLTPAEWAGLRAPQRPPRRRTPGLARPGDARLRRGLRRHAPDGGRAPATGRCPWPSSPRGSRSGSRKTSWASPRPRWTGPGPGRKATWPPWCRTPATSSPPGAGTTSTAAAGTGDRRHPGGGRGGAPGPPAAMRGLPRTGTGLERPLTILPSNHHRSVIWEKPGARQSAPECRAAFNGIRHPGRPGRVRRGRGEGPAGGAARRAARGR